MRHHSTSIRAARGVALGLLVAVLGTAASPADEEPRTIVVSGSGRVQAPPDAAYLDAGVTSEARQAKTAIAANGEVVKALLAALRERGLDPKDIQTRQLQLSPQYPQGSGARRSGITGYRVTSRVRVRVRQIDEVGGVLDTLVAAGANEIGGVSFTVLEPDALLDRARAAAVADALRKATLLARETGGRLGAVLEIRDGVSPIPDARGRRAYSGEGAMAAQSVPIATGELEFSVQLSVVYALLDRD